MSKATKGILVAVVGLGSACGFFEDSCIAEGTMVLVPSGLALIESLRVGDRVYALDVSTHELVETSITAIRSARRECVAAGVGDGESLRCTPNHPLYDPEEGVYAPASEWIEGRRTRLLRVTGKGGPQEIGVHDTVVHSGVFEVFDLSVESEHHNYVAGGVLVHNKTPDESTNGFLSETGEDTDSTAGASSTDTGAETTRPSSGTGNSGASSSMSGATGSSSGSGGSGTGSGSSGTTG